MYWTCQKVNNNTFKMTPSERIYTPFIDYPNIFNVSLASRKDSEDKLKYIIKPNYDT